MTTANEIIVALADADPVYGPIHVTGSNGRKWDSVRICALCRRRSAHGGENVTHTSNCPWLPAASFRKRLFAKYPQCECGDYESFYCHNPANKDGDYHPFKQVPQTTIIPEKP